MFWQKFYNNLGNFEKYMQILQPLKELYKHFQNTPTILSTYTMLYLDY